jgi:hypothetical protein
MTLSLSCDHRIVDGARGTQFLHTLADLIENPLWMRDQGNRLMQPVSMIDASSTQTRKLTRTIAADPIGPGTFQFSVKRPSGTVPLATQERGGN